MPSIQTPHETSTPKFEELFPSPEFEAVERRRGLRTLASSNGLGWQGLQARRVAMTSFEGEDKPAGHPYVIYHLTGKSIGWRQVDDHEPEEHVLAPGQLCLTPATARVRWNHRQRTASSEILLVMIRRSLYEEVAASMGRTGGSGVTPRFVVYDSFLEQLMIAVANALRSPLTVPQPYMDSLARMIASQLAVAHSGGADEAVGESPTYAHAAVTRLTDYIEANLNSDLNLDVLAQEASLSSFHLIRSFNNIVGVSPHQYVLTRRIERAKMMLRSTDIAIADIARSCGFSSQSHLSGRFQRVVGLSPFAYRRRYSAQQR